ncbi:unnamed protein product [Dicrocoelium dendriticum]|nr:unnamed protein product [Dicrocoelium dendriticum]
MLKKFKVDADDPVSWQPGLVEREIVDLLDGKHSQSIEITPKRAEANSPEIFKTENGVLKQRLIGAGDICPICQDELLSEKRNPVTYCRKGCGNSVHIRCMRVWTDHQRREKTIASSADSEAGSFAHSVSQLPVYPGLRKSLPMSGMLGAICGGGKYLPMFRVL